MTIPTLDDVHAFLLGERSLDGKWFGEDASPDPPYWWRKFLREALDPEVERLRTALVETSRHANSVKGKALAMAKALEPFAGIHIESWRADEEMVLRWIRNDDLRCARTALLAARGETENG